MSEQPTPDDLKSPFPGMDPYLESRWSDIHTSMSTYARDAIAEQLPPGLVARLEEYVALESDSDGIHSYRPDVTTFEAQAAAPSAPEGAAAEWGVQVAAEPVLVARAPESETWKYIKVLETQTGRLITAIEFLSPKNKVGEGAEQFREKQSEMMQAGVNIVEVDLVRRGQWVVSAPQHWAPVDVSHPYRICVVRARRRHTAEMYRVSLREPLPTIRIPLRPDDADIPLDLQELLNMAYVRGGYATTNYTEPPVPPLSPDDDAWADKLLRELGRR